MSFRRSYFLLTQKKVTKERWPRPFNKFNANRNIELLNVRIIYYSYSLALLTAHSKDGSLDKFGEFI